MGEIAKLLGEPIGGQVAQQVALRGIKAAALATRPSPSQDRGYAYVDFTAGPYRPSGVRAVAFVPGAYAEEPELFYGPFAQVGSYLKGKGVIESEGVAFALDLALDPLNLVSGGTAGAAGKLGIKGISGLTRTGKVARLISAMTAGGEIRNGAHVIDRVVGVLEEASHLAAVSPEIKAAAMAGDDAALKAIVNGARQSKEIGETYKPLIEAMHRDRKSLGKFLEHLDDFKKQYGEAPLPEEFFLQGTTRGRLAAGQVNPFISVVRPSNPLTHPLKFTRQMLGFHYANERFVLPMSRSAVTGLEKVGAGALFEIEGAVKPFENIKEWEKTITALESRRPALLERMQSAKAITRYGGDKSHVDAVQLEIDSLDASIADSKRLLGEARSKGEIGPGMFDRIVAEEDAFKAAKFTAGDLDATNAIMSIHMARVLAGAPTDRFFADVGYEAVNEQTLDKAYRMLNPDAPKEIPAATMEAFKNDVLKDLNGARRAIDGVRIQYRNGIMDELASDLRRSLSADPAMQAEEGLRLTEAQIDVVVNQARRAMDVFSIKSLQMDAYSPGNGLAARASFQGMLSRLVTDNTRAVIKGAYKGRLAREFIAEVPQAILSHPGLFELRDGKYFLKGSVQQIDEAGAALFQDSLRRSKAANGSAHLEEHLRTEGLNPEVSRLVTEIKATYDMIGKNLVANEGVLKALREDYFTRVWRWSDKGIKQYHIHADPKGLRSVMSDDAERQLEALLGDEIKVMAADANQGKVSFEEARKFTENQLLHAEKAGLGTYEKDGVALFSAYLESAGKSVLINRLWRDLPDISGALTRGALGKRAPTVADDVLRKAKRIMNTEPPRDVRAFYKKMFVRPRILTPLDNVEALFEGGLARTMQRMQGDQQAFLGLVANEAKRVSDALDAVETELTTRGVRAIEAGEREIAALKKSMAPAMAALERAEAGEMKKALASIREIEASLAARHEQTAHVLEALQADWTKKLNDARKLLNTAEEAARTRVAARLSGKKMAYGYRLRMKGSSESVPFAPEWAQTLDVPENLVGSKQIRTGLVKEIDSDEMLAAVRGDVAHQREKLGMQAAALRKKAASMQEAAVKQLDEAEAVLARMEKRLPEAERGLLAAEKRTGAFRKQIEAKAKRIDDNLVSKIKQVEDALGDVAEAKAGAPKLARQRVMGRLRAQEYLAKARKEAALKGPGAAKADGGLWVFEDDYNQLAEAFAIREKVSSNFWRKYDKWNAAFKSVVLIGDVFHFNVLSISQALLNPASIMKHLYDDAGKLLPGAAEGGFNLSNAAVKAGVGAAVGAGAGAVSGQDERGVATFSLVGALYGAVIGAAMNNARTGLRAAMNPANIDTLHWMGMGGWRGRPDDRSIGLLNRSLKVLRDKLAREPDNGALIHAIDGVRHVADGWDELLWSTLHNGSKHHYFQVKWGQELPKLEGRAVWATLSETEQFALKSGLAREIVQTSNNVFGGQTMRFLFDNPEFQHIARRFLLSPDWTASRLALASGFFMNMDPAKQALIGAGLGVGVQAVESGGDPDHIFSWRGPVLGAGLGLALGKWAKNIGRRMATPGDVMAKEARRIASSALLGGYVFANAVNYGLTGRWLFQNPEGKKTSIDIGGGNWVQLGKPWVEPFEFAGIYEPGKHRIPLLSRGFSKGATLPVSAVRLVTNTNGFGGLLIMPDDSPFEMAGKILDVTIPLPIITSGPARLAVDALQGRATQQQIGAAGIRSLGFPVRGPGRGGVPLDVGALQRVIQSSAGRFSAPPPALVGSPSLLETGL